MAVRGQDIASVIKRQIEEFGGELSMVDVGTVVSAGVYLYQIRAGDFMQMRKMLLFN